MKSTQPGEKWCKQRSDNNHFAAKCRSEHKINAIHDGRGSDDGDDIVYLRAIAASQDDMERQMHDLKQVTVQLSVRRTNGTN